MSDRRVCHLGRCPENGSKEQRRWDRKKGPDADREMWHEESPENRDLDRGLDRDWSRAVNADGVGELEKTLREMGKCLSDKGLK
ncbi:hypothetical protein TNCV_3878021 [Trichonephila clavipes]|nr:hypothetical protein TNCV_3878021 [Trichonephila clavipes]